MFSKRSLATVASKAAQATKVFETSRVTSISEPKTVDVLVVGAGPAGLSLCAGLKSSSITKDLKISLIEGSDLCNVRDFHDDTPSGFTNRISSLTPRSINFLQRIGGWDYIKQDRIQPYDSIVVTEGLSSARLSIEHEEMATMIENVNIQSALYQRIKELEMQSMATQSIAKDKENKNGMVDADADVNVNAMETFGLEIQDKTRVVDISTDELNGWPLVSLSNGDVYRTRLLVGADGKNSPVRKFAGIESRGWFYEKFGTVATVKLEYTPFQSIGWQRFLPTGPIALLPLPDDDATIVWSTTDEISKLIVESDPELVTSLINAAFVLSDVDMNYYYGCLKNGKTQGLVSDIEWRMKRAFENYTEDEVDEKFPVRVTFIDASSRARFPLSLSHADKYISERIALVGDAAHTTHPLAGQGLNMGQGDVESLVKSIEKGMLRGLDIGNSLVLEPYWAERYPINAMLLGVVDKLHKLYSATAEPIVALRSFGLNAVNQLSIVKDFMVKQVSGK